MKMTRRDLGFYLSGVEVLDTRQCMSVGVSMSSDVDLGTASCGTCSRHGVNVKRQSPESDSPKRAYWRLVNTAPNITCDLCLSRPPRARTWSLGCQAPTAPTLLLGTLAPEQASPRPRSDKIRCGRPDVNIRPQTSDHRTARRSWPDREVTPRARGAHDRKVIARAIGNILGRGETCL